MKLIAEGTSQKDLEEMGEVERLELQKLKLELELHVMEADVKRLHTEIKSIKGLREEDKSRAVDVIMASKKESEILQDQLNALASDRDSCHSSERDLETNLGQINGKIAHQQSLGSRVQLISTYLEGLVTNKSERIKSLRSELAAKKEKESSLTASIPLLKEQLCSEKGGLCLAREELHVERAQTEILTATVELRGEEKKRLKAEVLSLKSNIEKEQAAFEQDQRCIQNLLSQYASFQAQVQNVQADIQAEEKSIATLKEGVTQITEKIREEEERSHASGKKIDLLKAELKEKQDNLSELRGGSAWHEIVAQENDQEKERLSETLQRTESHAHLLAARKEEIEARLSQCQDLAARARDLHLRRWSRMKDLVEGILRISQQATLAPLQDLSTLT